MENLKSEKNWDVLGKKVAEYVPDEYTNGDWEAMSKMLDPGKPSFLQILKSYALLITTIALLTTTLIALNYSDWNKEIGIKEVVDSSLTEQKAVEAEKDIIEVSETAQAEAKNSNENNLDKSESIVTTVKDIKKAERLSINNTSEFSKIQRGVSQSSISSINRSKIGINNNSINVGNKNITPVSLRSDENISIYEMQSTFSTAKENTSAVKNQTSNTNPQKELSERHTNKSLTTSTTNKFEVLNKIPLLNLKPVGLTIDDSPIEIGEIIDTDIIDKGIKFGLQIGLNNSITNYSPSNSDLLIPPTSQLPFIGVFAKKQLSRRWGIELGVQYKKVHNYNLAQIFSFDWINHDGNRERATVNFRYNDYKSIDIPLVAKYKLSKRVSLLGGLRYSYLGLTKASVSNLGELSNEEFSSAFSALLPSQGFWNHDFGVILGLEYQIKKHWSLGFRVNQGLRDITPDNLYGGNRVNHLNSDFQISLKFTL